MTLVLSLFPGIGLLDRAFEEAGFTVVRGPDVLWGGDIRRFHPPAGVFDGVIGGPPCKRFSKLADLVKARYGESRLGPDLIPEFERCVQEAAPQWFVMENVPRAPLPVVDGFEVRDLILNNRWLGEEQNRVRRFSYGTHDGRPLVIDVALFEAPVFEYAVTSNGGGVACLRRDGQGRLKTKRSMERALTAARRPISRLCELQGLPADFMDGSPFTVSWQRAVLANGVPLRMGRTIAQAVRRSMGYPVAEGKA